VINIIAVVHIMNWECYVVLQSDGPLYSYAVITVDAHRQLSWMH